MSELKESVFFVRAERFFSLRRSENRPLIEMHRLTVLSRVLALNERCLLLVDYFKKSVTVTTAVTRKGQRRQYADACVMLALA